MTCLKINQPAIQTLRMKSVKKQGFKSLEVGSQLWRRENKAAIEAYKQLV